MRIIVNIVDKEGYEQEYEFEPTNPIECGVALWSIATLAQYDSEFTNEEPETHHLN